MKCVRCRREARKFHLMHYWHKNRFGWRDTTIFSKKWSDGMQYSYVCGRCRFILRLLRLAIAAFFIWVIVPPMLKESFASPHLKDKLFLLLPSILIAIGLYFICFWESRFLAFFLGVPSAITSKELSNPDSAAYTRVQAAMPTFLERLREKEAAEEKAAAAESGRAADDELEK